MWILNQKKEKLWNTHQIYQIGISKQGEKHCVDINGDNVLGLYNSKERALEVFALLSKWLSFEFEDIEFCSNIFEMPED